MRCAPADMIEMPGISAIEQPHRVREACIWRSDHQVIVVAHEAVRDTLEGVAMNDGFKVSQEYSAVIVEDEQRLAVADSSGNVIDAAFDNLAGSSWHVPSVGTSQL